MKKTTFIIIGIVAVVLLFLVWVYLLIYGTPKSVTGAFTDFGLFGGAAEPTTPESTPIVDTPIVDVKTEKLRQLTTRPVAGFREYHATTSEPRFILYAEAGTGHIYQINLETGEEVRLSNTTIPNAESAVFSPDQKYVAIRSGYSTQSEVVLLTLIAGGTSIAENLTPKMTDFIFSTENELLYTELTGEGTAGRILSPSTKVVRTQFSIPFQAVTMMWGMEKNTPHYAYPKTTTKLNGYLYAIKNGTVVRQPIMGPGLTAEASSDYIIETELQGEQPVSSIYTLATKNVSPATIIFEPSKCAFSPNNAAIMYCGYELTDYSYNYPDDWYRGIRSFNDRIWQLNLKTGSASQLISPEKATGRQIDITNMNTGIDGKMLYFTNKNDNTLWLYEI
jgi:hypothetical protein